MKIQVQRSKKFIPLILIASFILGACSFPSESATPVPEVDVLATMVAQTLTAQPSDPQPEGATQPPQDATEPPTDPPTETPTLEPTEPPEDIHSEGQGVTIKEPDCYDLDDGVTSESGDPRCDFTIRTGPDGDYNLTVFIPLIPARFGFGGVFPQEPDREKCASSPDLSSNTETIAPLGSLYVCYQTNEGRFGYLYFTHVSADGVTYNWRTYDPPEAVPTPVPTLTPRVDQNLPTGDPDWIDTFDSAANWSPYSDDSVIFEIENGRAIMIAPQPNNTFRFMLSYPDLTDFYLEAFFKTASACSGKDRYGLVVRTTKVDGDYKNYYIFGISCDGSYYLDVYTDGEQTPIIDWTPDAAIKSGPNQINNISIRMEGDRIVLYANRERLAEINDDTYTDGKFGLFIGSSTTENFTVEVDDMAYWNLP